MIRVKNGVSVDNSHPRIFAAAALAAVVWAKYGSPDLWITGGNEGGHSTGPRGFHRLPDGTCCAWDFRTWSIPKPEDRREAVKELAKLLGPYYDVLFEEEIRDPTTGKVLRGEHAHCQVDFARPGTSK
jgi:hypothetical protein